MANRPFDLVVGKEQAAQLVAAAGDRGEAAKFVQSGAGLLERLNTSSCMGCHQSSSTAGFHFLGVDRFDLGRDAEAIKAALDGNKLQLPFSPHVYAELARRKNYVERVSRDMRRTRFVRIRLRPPQPGRAQAPAYSIAGDNMPCPLNADLADTAKWSCNAARNLSCQAVVTNASASSQLGQCVPAAQNISAGLSLPLERHRGLDREEARKGPLASTCARSLTASARKSSSTKSPKAN